MTETQHLEIERFLVHHRICGMRPISYRIRGLVDPTACQVDLLCLCGVSQSHRLTRDDTLMLLRTAPLSSVSVIDCEMHPERERRTNVRWDCTHSANAGARLADTRDRKRS
jgi:hypothetical protein